jgi:hypothetical protein
MLIGEVFWHDGKLVSFDLKGGKDRAASLTCNLYPNFDSKDRECWRFDFEQVVRLIISVDMLEIERNVSAGCISDGVLRESAGQVTLSLLLTGGYIEITCGHVLLARQPTRVRRIR